MASQTLTRTPTLPTRAALVQSGRPIRTLFFWAAGAALAGGLVGLAIEVVVAVLTDRPFDFWFVEQGVLFAEAVGLSALVAARYAFPLFETLPSLMRYTLVLATLLGGAIAVSALSLLLRPGIVFSRPTTFVALIGANTVLALVVGGALITWERFKRSLAQAYEDLRVKEALEREMALAREVQQALLPERAPEAAGYEIVFHCRSAALVGGDTMDFVPLSGERLGLAVGDVSGKGISAALLMANVQALIRAVAVLEDDPARVNAILSEALESRTAPERYVTLAFVVLDPRTGALRYSVAGHPPPIIVGAGGARLLDRGGVPLAMLRESPRDGGEDCLARGETLVMYTDGVTEAPGGGDPERDFGQSRLIEVIGAARSLGAKGVLDSLLSDIDRHLAGAPPHDDTTVVVVHRPADLGS